MSNPNFTTTPPLAPPPIQPTAEIVTAIADVLRFIDRKRRAAAVFADDTPRPDRSPAPPVKKESKHK